MIYILNKGDKGHLYLKVEAEKHPELLDSGIKRVLVWFETGHKAHLALNKPKDMAHPVLYLSQTLCHKLGIKEGDQFLAKIIPDETPYQFDMPDEFQAVLDTDPAALACFEKLTAGNQRSLIYLVQSVQSDEKRIERSLRIASALKNGIHSARVILKKNLN